MEKQEYNRITQDVIRSAIDVHRELGPGLLESVYEICLIKELKIRNIQVENQIILPIEYKGQIINKEFMIDLLVENEVVVELKAVGRLRRVHEVQLVTYLKLAKKKLGLLINFNVPILIHGIKRRVNNF